MNIKETLAKLEKFTEAKLEPKYGANTIDFDSIGCGINVETGTSEDGFLTLYLQGYSSNTSKNLDFKSTIEVGYGKPKEERQQANAEFRVKKEEAVKALVQLADEFDKKIEETLKSLGFEKE